MHHNVLQLVEVAKKETDSLNLKLIIQMQTELQIKDDSGNSHNHMLPAVSVKKRKCYNCKFAGQQFKVSNVTHLHCEDEKQYPKEKWESGELTAWDSLQKFSDTCEFHEFKDSVVK